MLDQYSEAVYMIARGGEQKCRLFCPFVRFNHSNGNKEALTKKRVLDVGNEDVSRVGRWTLRFYP